MVSLIGSNFYQVYKKSEEGKQYIGKSLIVEELPSHLIFNMFLNFAN